MATAALAELIASFPPVLALDSDQRAQLHEDLLFVVQFLAAARLVDDDTVFEEFLAWLDELLRSRGVRLDVLTAGLEALTPRLIAVDRDTKRLLDAAAAR
jgi:hypothetical protein